MNLDLLLEIIAVVSGVLCVFLLTRERIEAWYFGAITVSIYVYIFWQQKLYSDMILHVVYVVLNVYGWYSWRFGGKIKDQLEVTLLSNWHRVIWGLVIIAGFLIWGYFMNRYTDADFAYIDAFTTVASLVAQWFLAKKKIENWILWIIVDVVAMVIYYIKGIRLTSLLYLIYLGLAVYGLITWYKHLGTDKPGEPTMESAT